MAGALFMLVSAGRASADDASVTVGPFADPPSRPDRRRTDPEFRDPGEPREAPIAVDDRSPLVEPRDPRRSAVRLQLGPTGITTGKGFGLGVGVGADFGTGSVGGRLSAAWLRGEGTNGDGSSTPTGDSVGQYGGEITLDLLKRGPLHPVVGMGVALLHVSRPDGSGYAGVGTGRIALDYALGLEDADVRIGADVTGGLVGPVDDDVNDLRAYALVGAHLAIGF